MPWKPGPATARARRPAISMPSSCGRTTRSARRLRARSKDRPDLMGSGEPEPAGASRGRPRRASERSGRPSSPAPDRCRSERRGRSAGRGRARPARPAGGRRRRRHGRVASRLRQARLTGMAPARRSSAASGAGNDTSTRRSVPRIRPLRRPGRQRPGKPAPERAWGWSRGHRPAPARPPRPAAAAPRQWSVRRAPAAPRRRDRGPSPRAAATLPWPPFRTAPRRTWPRRSRWTVRRASRPAVQRNASAGSPATRR